MTAFGYKQGFCEVCGGTEFDKQKYCKECRRIYTKQYREDNREYFKKKATEWNENNVEKRAKDNRDWIRNNRERHNENSRKWSANNPEKVKEMRKNYYDTNKKNNS